jgi:hypothetical protein
MNVPSMNRVARLVLLLALLAPAATRAGQTQLPASFTVISPIFGQLVAFSQPSNFVPGFEKADGTNYIREAVPKGETVEKWTQMITVTGAKELADDPNVTPIAFASVIANGFKKACPKTFSAMNFGNLMVAGYKAVAVVASCGTVSGATSARAETALVLAIKGASDYYTIQWAERAKASDQPPMIDQAVWKKRLALLEPIRLCPIVQGEEPPYPSCLNR